MEENLELFIGIANSMNRLNVSILLTEAEMYR